MNQEVLRDENRQAVALVYPGWTNASHPLDGLGPPSYLIMADLDALWTYLFLPTSAVRPRLHNDVPSKALHQRFRQAIFSPIRTHFTTPQ